MADDAKTYVFGNDQYPAWAMNNGGLFGGNG